jgi:hypothetical protein
MSDGRTTSHGEFHAAIREMEPCILRAEDRGELNPTGPDGREFPDLHLGTSVADVKVRAE